MVILIIDSSGLIIERIVHILEESNKRKDVYRAVSYIEAKKYLTVIRPDIILLDICLPENKSIDLLKEIKDLEMGIQVIIMTNQAEVFNKKRYLQLGAELFLDKYHDFEKIPAAIDALWIEKRIRNLNNII